MQQFKKLDTFHYLTIVTIAACSNSNTVDVGVELPVSE